MANKELRKRLQFGPRYYVKLINARNIDQLSENTFGELSVIIIIEHVELMLKTCNTVFVCTKQSSRLPECADTGRNAASAPNIQDPWSATVID